MTKQNSLIELIQSDPRIKRFKELEAIIDRDDELQSKYKHLLDLQKSMVQKEAKNHPQAKDAKILYEEQKLQIMDHILMGEYLDLLEEINNDLAMIQEIIEYEIEKDFD